MQQNGPLGIPEVQSSSWRDDVPVTKVTGGAMKFQKGLASKVASSPSSSRAQPPMSVRGESARASGGRVSRQAILAKERAKKVTDMKPGFLRRARIRKSVTRNAYSDAWEQFLTFCVAECLLAGLRCKFVSMSQIDQSLEKFAEHLYSTGSSKYVITCALQNCNIEYPQWPTSSRTNYPLTKAAKKGWGNLEPGCSKDPCPLEVAFWIAFDMLLRGQALFALAVVLGFDTYISPEADHDPYHNDTSGPAAVALQSWLPPL